MWCKLKVRQAVKNDAFEVSQLLEELTAVGKRNLPSDENFVSNQYIEHTDNIRCSVAVDQSGEILGIQILKRACEANAFGVEPGWGIIGTHVKPSAARRGVGKALFAATFKAAKEAGLEKIDATIGANNPEGLAYYEAIGFRTYKTSDGKVSKCFNASSFSEIPLNPNR